MFAALRDILRQESAGGGSLCVSLVGVFTSSFKPRMSRCHGSNLADGVLVITIFDTPASLQAWTSRNAPR